MWMLGKGVGSNARKLLNASGTIKSMDVVMPVRSGDMEVKVRLRTGAKPDEDVAVLLSHLGLRLPSRSKTVQNVVEKKSLFFAQNVGHQQKSFSNCGTWVSLKTGSGF